MQQHTTTPKDGHYVCAIDASLTGLAIATMLGGEIRVLEEHSSTASRKGHKGKAPPLSPRERIVRYDALTSKVMTILTGSERKPPIVMPRWHVFIEGYSFASAHASHQLGEFGGTLRRKLLRHPQVHTVTEVQPAQLKKFCAGKGNANKIEVATALTQRYGVAFGSDNRADAYGLAQLGACVVGDAEAANQVQREIIKTVREHYEKDIAQYPLAPHGFLPDEVLHMVGKVGT